MRRKKIVRDTKETKIVLALEIDGSGAYEINTGCGFLDHMLELFTRHGRFDIAVDCNGDTHVDCHHTVEDIGIAMGAMGSDAAIEAADVVLMDDDPMKIAKGIQISRKCIRIVYENIVFSLGVKLTCLLLVAIGIANMWMGIFADVGVMVLAVLNAIRALRTSKN